MSEETQILSEGAPTYDLGKLHGGLRLPSEKDQSTTSGIVVAPVPAQLVLPITQHVGTPASPVVGIGERVLKGQLIADADGPISAPVHASSSGKVIAIEPWPVSRRYGDPAPCIVIECDGEDTAIDTSEIVLDYTTLDREALLDKILHGGIVGLGGAVFPTAQKLMQAISGEMEYLILNGVECEPYISCDDMLMREYAMDVLKGGQILLHALNLSECLVVVESDKPEAIDALTTALGELEDETCGSSECALPIRVSVRRGGSARTAGDESGGADGWAAVGHRLCCAECRHRCRGLPLDRARSAAVVPSHHGNR